MSFDPVLNAPFVIQLHLTFALPAVCLGPVALFRNRRDRLHKTLGYAWILAMIGVSVSGLFIESNIAIVAHFGPIHVLCVLALWGMAEGLWYIRQGNIAKHRASMQSVWFGAMGLAGLFTLAPGRILNRAVFGERMELGWIAIAVGGAALAILWRWHLRRADQILLGKAGGLD